MKLNKVSIHVVRFKWLCNQKKIVYGGRSVSDVNISLFFFILYCKFNLRVFIRYNKQFEDFKLWEQVTNNCHYVKHFELLIEKMMGRLIINETNFNWN